MKKNDWVYIAHMLEMSQKAIQLTNGKSRFDYDQEEVLRLALTRIIQVIGEAAQRVSNEIQKEYSEIPWHEIVGMRHRIVHDYLNVDEDVIWEVVKHDLPTLAKQLMKILPSEYQQ
jgi:uncharacterized protein with HEPN domain